MKYSEALAMFHSLNRRRRELWAGKGKRMGEHLDDMLREQESVRLDADKLAQAAEHTFKVGGFCRVKTRLTKWGIAIDFIDDGDPRGHPAGVYSGDELRALITLLLQIDGWTEGKCLFPIRDNPDGTMSGPLSEHLAEEAGRCPTQKETP